MKYCCGKKALQKLNFSKRFEREKDGVLYGLALKFKKAHNSCSFIMSLSKGIGTVLCDGGRGGGRHQRRGGRTLDTGYSAPDGGIFTSGFHTDNANFGNQYSAQNVQPSYGQPQYGSGSRGK